MIHHAARTISRVGITPEIIPTPEPIAEAPVDEL